MTTFTNTTNDNVTTMNYTLDYDCDGHEMSLVFSRGEEALLSFVIRGRWVDDYVVTEDFDYTENVEETTPDVTEEELSLSKEMIAEFCKNNDSFSVERMYNENTKI